MSNREKLDTTGIAPAPAATGVLQRKCAACGNHTIAGGDCEDCKKKTSIGVQTKLTVGAAGDAYEQEADRVADQVLATPSRGAVRGAPLQIQRHSGESDGPTSSAPASVDQALSDSGRSLDPAVRQNMEQRFGHDFSRVRVHSGTDAEQSASDVNARAYTVGHDIVFGTGQFAPGTNEGQRLLAHELTHVVQQRTGTKAGIQRAPDLCKTKKRADAEADILSSVKAAAKDEADLPSLYLALKRARACFSDFDEAAFLKLVPDSTTIYTDATRKAISKGHSKVAKTDDRTLAWAESLKSFAGYLASGFDSASRLLTGENKRKLGITTAPSHKSFRDFADKQNESKHRAAAQKAFAESNVLVFSGHQYAQYKLPGVWNTGDWDVTLDVRGITGPLNNVKLLIGTSCATLCKEAFEVWKPLFPNAFFLGAARSTPLNGAVLANSFVNNLAKDLLFDPGAPGVMSAISAWKTAVEKTQSAAVRGGVLDIAGGKVEFWDGKKWVSEAATDPDNDCKTKGDYSGSVPDPRASASGS
ncbi:MAG: DUF4157 domain-containing protein [Pyrinomonadaceae bacterium]